tara:strand:- start:36 stop:974 length:939 start_codon:yes stop_codon:yes gene_type:complete
VIKIYKIFYIILITFFCFTKSNATIEDSIFATVGNKAVLQSDIIKEIKIMLILNGQSFSEEMREELEAAAVRNTVERTVKEIEIEKYEFLKINDADLEKELNKLAINLKMDLDTLKSIFIANGIDFTNVINNMRTELLWNGLIFEMYRDRLSINEDEIDEQLKLLDNTKEEMQEYLLSEIIIKSVPKDEIESKIEEIENKIKMEGFEKVALNLSISETGQKGGDLGWVNENVISGDLKTNVINTPVGKTAKPILLPVGILFLKVRDKRTSNKTINIEEEKNRLVNAEKTKILNMHSLSHYDKLRRLISIKYY